MKRIDLVFPYVDSSKITWQQAYSKATGKYYNNNEKQRFYADGELLRYKLRATEKYMPWIRNVYMIVHDKLQVPEWINQENVIIVEHKDFIPNEVLPVFNSCAIEMFVHLIKGLSDYFIYSNDDMMPNGFLTPDDFFYQDYDGSIKVKNKLEILQMKEAQKRKRSYFVIARNSYKFANEIATVRKNRPLTEIEYPQVPHVSTPMLKDFNMAIYESLTDEILDSVTPLRDFKNFNQYLFAFSYMTNGLSRIDTKYRHRYCATTKADLPMILKSLANENYKEIVINDMEKTDFEVYPYIYKAYAQKLPNKCKYEK